MAKEEVIAEKTEEKKEPLLAGGPEDGIGEEVVAETEETPTEKTTKFKVGNKEFDSQEAAQKYIEDLELDKKLHAARAQGVADAEKQIAAEYAEKKPSEEKPKENVFLIDGKPIEEALFDDPAKTLAAVAEQSKKDALSEMRQEITERENVKQTWEDFYEKNPDLAVTKDVVKLILADNQQILDLNVNDAMDALATKARARVAEIRESGKKTEELPDEGVFGAGASQTGTEDAIAKTDPKPLDFVGQLNKTRARIFQTTS